MESPEIIPIQKILAENLRKIRKEMGLSQDALADLAKFRDMSAYFQETNR